MEPISVAHSSLLGRLNERQVLRTLRSRGPLSRAEVARQSGISAPTASKAVEALLRAGLIEEGDAVEACRGRPARRLHLASRSAQVLGVVLDAEECRVVAGSLDGELSGGAAFRTPASYEELLARLETECRRLVARRGLKTLAVGISIPGLVDYRTQRGVLSPNLPLTDGRSPADDLGRRLELECVLVQESHALCLAEYYFGEAQGIDEFAMLDVGTGVGLGVLSHGRLLSGHCGLAGEIGHITIDPNGRTCGCGNRGCLETVASDSALLRALSERMGRRLDFGELSALVREGDLDPEPELGACLRALAIGTAAVINLFNPSTLFIHGKLINLRPALLDDLIAHTRTRALEPSLAACTILRARGSKRLGAIAAAVEHLTDLRVPVHLPAFVGGGSSNGRGRHAVPA